MEALEKWIVFLDVLSDEDGVDLVRDRMKDRDDDATEINPGSTPP